MIYILFFRSGLRQKSLSVIPLEIEPTETESAIEADRPDDIADESPDGNPIVTLPNLPNAFVQSNDPNSMAAIDILQSYVIQEQPDLTALPTQLLEQVKILNQALDASNQDVLPALEMDLVVINPGVSDPIVQSLNSLSLSANNFPDTAGNTFRNEELISWDRGLACLFYLILKFRILEG